MEDAASTPTARALRTLALVQARPGVGAAALAERLGVTDRAVRRYVAILRDAGVVIDANRGPEGGYRLGRSLRPPPMVFTAAEALGLVMAVLDGHHAAADPDDPVGSALGKLIESLPANAGRQAERMRRHARAAPDRRAVRPEAGVTAALVEALAEGRAVRVAYVPSSGRAFETRVDPWAVVVRHGRWYLIGLSAAAGEPRALRLDRIERLEQLNATVAAPPDLDPVSWLEEHLGTGWPHPVHIVFDASPEEVAPWVTPPTGRIRPLAGGGCELLGSTNNPEAYVAERLAPIPFVFRIIEGPEIAAAARSVAGRLADSLAITQGLDTERPSL